MLMLAGALAVSGIVQAQTPPPAPFGTFTGAVGQEEAAGIITTVVLPNFDKQNQEPPEATPDTIVSAVLSSDTPADLALFSSIDGNIDSDTGTVDITRAEGTLAAAPHTYELVLTIVVDQDDGTDSDTTGGPTNDADVTLRANVVIHVIDDSDDLTFHAEGGQIFNGNQVSTFERDLDTDPQVYEVKGLQSNHKIVSAMVCSETETDGATCTAHAGLELGAPGGSKYPLMVKNSIAATTGGVVRFIIDTNTAKDVEDLAGEEDDAYAGDNFTDNDHDIVLSSALTFTVIPASAVIIVEANIGTDGAPNMVAADLTIKENVAAGHQFGQAIAHGRLTGSVPAPDGQGGTATVNEALDGVITDSNRFIARTTAREQTVDDVGGRTFLNVEYTGGSPIAAGQVYEMTLSVNGDTGFINRTATSKIRVTISAANLAPEAAATQSNFVREDDPKDAFLIKEDSPVGTVSASDNEALTYEIKDASEADDFKVDNNGVISAARNIPAGESNNQADVDADPDGDVELLYTLDTVTDLIGWKYVNGKITSDTPNMDITRKVTVTVSDGVESNNQDVEFTVTIDVNEKATLVTEADVLPGSPYEVTFGMVDRDLTPDDDSDDDEPTATYSVMVRAAQRDLPLTVLNVSDLVNDVDAPDDADMDFDEVSGPRHLTVSNDGALDLLVMPVGANTEDGKLDTIYVTATDGYNDGDPAEPDVDFYIDVTVIEEIRPIESKFVGIVVAENSTACSLNDGGGTCPIAGIFVGAAKYAIESGVDLVLDDPDTADVDEGDFSIDGNGLITVNTEPDYEADLNPAFIVRVDDANDDLLGLVSVRVSITDVDEDPTITTIIGTAWVYEDAQVDEAVLNKVEAEEDPSPSDPPIVISAEDPEETTLTYSIVQAAKVPFVIDAGTGALTVSGALDRETLDSYSIDVVATDAGNNDSEALTIVIHILDTNEAPEFVSPSGDDAVTTISEARTYDDGAIMFGPNNDIAVFKATDEDGDDLEFGLIQGPISELFEIANPLETAKGEWQAELRVKQGMDILDYEDADYDTTTGYFVQVVVQDGRGKPGVEPLRLIVKLENLNDETPTFDGNPLGTISVAENTARATVLGNSYAASDPDGFAITYRLTGTDSKSFSISTSGALMTLESLDYDSDASCNTCNLTVVANDGAESITMNVTVTVTNVEDSVSTLGVTKANPVPGTESGNPMSALAGTKSGGNEYLWNLLDCTGMLDLVGASDTEANRGIYCAMWDGLSPAAKAKVSAALSSEAPAESPYSLPASYGSAPVNFVETEWANWGTIVRIEVTAESPSIGCGNGNQCVVIDVNSDSADTSIKLQAFRTGTQENKFVAALKLVELSGDATDSTDAGVYQHTDGGVAALKVDEEDEIEIEFGNLRGSIDVENEDPEISNFAPEHEAAFNDADVDYTFTVTDSNSGMPEPEDLPDVDGDADYTPVVALISGGQCETHAGNAATVKTDGGTLSMAASINEDESLYCTGTAQDGEYDASVGSTFGFAPIRDDKDFDEIDDGFDVETTIVLRENKKYYVTFIACDNAGNCSFYDPDGNDDFEELAQITVDTEDPVFVEARTGLTWDSTDNEYDDNRSYIQVIFNDLTTLNTATVEIDDFVVEGHTISDVHIFENPDDDDVDWEGGPNKRYAATSSMNLRDIHRYRDLENVVFIELADELLADETPDVTIVPNGVEDQAGNEQDDGDHEADDWISPSFTIVSIVSTRETSQDEILAGDDDEVTVVVTTDERLDSTRPTVTVTYVNAPAGSVKTKGTEDCDDGTGTRERGEIAHEGNDKCLDSDAATGGRLNNSVEKVSNTEWIVTITEPKDTGYYNFRISGRDRSPQENPGSEGIAPNAIVTDFFDADGDVNVDDAIFFEGDINLPKPEVRVSGVGVRDNEADVEFRSPLFVELDFAANHHAVCGRNADTDERMANCTNENGEYAEDNFDDIVVTSFVLDGVDITDSVKTTDNQSFLVSLESISIGDHTATVQAVDQAGNVFEDTLEIDFEVNDRDPFEKRLSPGWNLVSLPGEPADSSIASVFGPGVEVRTVYSYDPVIPGGWQVAVRETLDSDWQGDLTEITGQRGYWVLSDAIQDWEVSIPRLAGGSAGTGTPIQPPVIPMYAGWNLIPVTDVSGNALSAGIRISAEVYLNSLDDGLDLARVLGFNTIKNEWFTVLDMQIGSPGDLRIGSGYWVFVREAAALVPGGVAGVSGGN